jgi:hypothetical protein
MVKVKNIVLRTVILGAMCCLLLAGPARADTAWLQRQKLLAADGVAGDYFGSSVSISGDYSIVGAFGDDDNRGSAYIFRWDGTGWVQQQKLTASDGAAGDAFSYHNRSVSISGDYVIIGAYGDDDKGSGSGSAYIFKRDGTSWSEQAKLTASDGADNDCFGHSVSISGDYAIVGSQYDDDKGHDSGSAYIFRWDGTGWVQQQKLTADDGAAGDIFGGFVSISGDYAIIEAIGDDDKGTDSGSAYIFKRDGTNWVQQQKLTASDGAAGDNFGYSVSINGDKAIVGAWRDDDKGTDSGSAYIFKREGETWVEQQKLLASDGAADDCFGESVSISGGKTIVGTRNDDSHRGSAYIFRWNGTSWVQQQKLTASDGAASDEFGCSVSISGDYVIVGAWLDDDRGDASGSAYIFVPPVSPIGTAFTYQGRLIDADEAADGLYDFQFKLYDSASNGNQIGGDVNASETQVNDGYFSVELDFGNVFDGNERWLEIGVRPGEQSDPNVYTTLSPRQELTPTPYAIYAETAGSCDSFWKEGMSQLGSKNIHYVDGDVGIGTTAPVKKLDVAGEVRSIVGGVEFYMVPKGAIIMWSGTLASIPSGWAFCDGTNGTPDLRDRFIVGAGNTYSPGNTGGSNTHTHSFTSGYSNQNLTHSHRQQYAWTNARFGDGTWGIQTDQEGQPTSFTSVVDLTSHSHSGSTSISNNLPPYFALAYIMKL